MKKGYLMVYETENYISIKYYSNSIIRITDWNIVTYLHDNGLSTAQSIK